MDTLPLLLLVGAAVVLMFFMSRRNRTQQTKQTEFRDNLEPGQQVMTSSGQLGRVVETEEGAVVIETTPGVHTRWVKAAITAVPPQFAAALEPEDDDEDDEEYDDGEYEDDDYDDADDDGIAEDDAQDVDDDAQDDDASSATLAGGTSASTEAGYVDKYLTDPGADEDKPTSRG